ncbi:hypothetical protein CF336_g7985 [Tilletia laevis]|nr:hypothetical protein CF336_g7985 [Tilletia laevis]
MTLSSQQPPDNSQLPGEAASLSQEIAALSPAGSLSANRIQRPPPETYSEQNNDDADYEDTSDNDDDSNLPSASTSNPSSQNTAGVQSTAAATLSTATTTSLPPQPPLPDRTRLALLARSSARCKLGLSPTASTVPRSQGTLWPTPLLCAKLLDRTVAFPSAPLATSSPPGGILTMKLTCCGRRTPSRRRGPLFGFLHVPPRFRPLLPHPEERGSTEGSRRLLRPNWTLSRSSRTIDHSQRQWHHPTTILAPPRCGLSRSPKCIPAKVLFASCSDDEEAVAIFQNSFARATDVFVIEAWTIHKRLASGSLRFKNEIVALLTKEEYGVPRNFRTPGRTSAEIPGPLRAFRITGK